jgi:arylsulfatase A-like enzyme
MARLVFVSLCVSASLLVPNARCDETPPRPNIVYLLADDLGWADVSFHGGEIKTPHLDALAVSGTRLEQYYVQSVCTPTRAAFLTGRYPYRLGLQVGVVRPWAQYGLSLEERTLPQALGEAGYDTAIVGKWHLGHFAPEYLPTRRGFAHQYGHYNGAIDYFTHVRDGGLDWHRDDQALREEGYSTELIAKEAVRILATRDPQKPLFLYVPFNAVHAPHQVPDKYRQGYTQLAEPRQTYAAMVTALDEAVGQIIAELDRQGLRDKTLVVFHSDNGGPNPGVVTSNGPLRGGKATLYEGGVRVPAVASWPGHIPAGASVEQPVHVVDWYPTLLKLAGASTEQPTKVDGQDIWLTVSAGQTSPHELIVLNTTPSAGAIRVGNWKLVLNGTREHNDGRDPESGKPIGWNSERDDSPAKLIELFDLSVDPYEKQNLADQQPGKVQELRARYDEIAREAIPPKVAPAAKEFRSPKVWGEADNSVTIVPDLSKFQDPSRWQILNGQAQWIEEAGRGWLRLLVNESDPNSPDTASVALVEGLEFQQGTIEVDLRGQNVRQRSFLGVTFHAVDEKTLEAVYFRPFNFQAEPPFKNRAVQYISWPEHHWSKLREESPGVYEHGVNPIPDPSDWFHARIEVSAEQIFVFVNNAPEPSLIVQRLTDRSIGKVGLWAGVVAGEYANLKITPK